MKKELRIERLIDYVKEKKVCSVEELQSIFDISLSTMHRDLNTLLEPGKINKYYGKIALKEKKDLIKNRIEENIELKKEIAKKALSYVKDGECVFLDNPHIDFVSTGGKLNTDFNSYIGPQTL